MHWHQTWWLYDTKSVSGGWTLDCDFDYNVKCIVYNSSGLTYFLLPPKFWGERLQPTSKIASAHAVIDQNYIWQFKGRVCFLE